MASQQSYSTGQRRYSTGAELLSEGKGVNFRVYAPHAKRVELALENPNTPTKYFEIVSENNGYFSKTLKEFGKHDLYRYRLDGNAQLLSDPTSRFQPDGPLGPSQIIDPSEYQWGDKAWKGLPLEGQIIYEMHIGTFTQEGTYRAAQQELAELADLGITIIEIMPLNDFSGKFGWGYDGVNLYAPTRLYGTPNDLKSFIDEAHRLHLAVILDVVYNHFGPHGNFMPQFASYYFSEEDNEWGKGINFDHPESRKYFLENMKYWIQEYHFDGFRIDATQAISSTTEVNILQEMCQTAKEACKGRKVIVIGENEPQDGNILRSIEENGYGFDGLWNDDFHHSAIVRLTGKRDAYYTDYLGKVQEFISAVKYGFLFQGQYYVWQDKCRGSDSLDIPPYQFVTFIQNHDQIANSGTSARIHTLTDFGNLKAMTALLFLTSNVPLIFQGQEFGSSSPFYYFADYKDHLAKAVKEGRKESLAQFSNLATEEMQGQIQDPGDPDTFEKSKLNFAERQTNEHFYALHKDLIKLRKTDPIFSNPKIKIDGAVLNGDAFVLRYFGMDKQHRLLIVNFGNEFEIKPAPEPLLAPLKGFGWQVMWSSEASAYRGQGTAPIDFHAVWKIPGRSALVLTLEGEDREVKNG